MPSLTSLLPALCLMLAPAAPAAGPLPLVEETHLRVALLPEEGRVDLRARLRLTPPETGEGRMLILQVGNDLRVLSVRGPSGKIEFRQGGSRVLLFPDPPFTEPASIEIHLSGIPLTRKGEPRLGRAGLLLTGDEGWYPRGAGTTKLRLSPDLPQGWTAMGSGLSLAEGRPTFAAVPEEGAGWLAAAPGTALVKGAGPGRVPVFLAGPSSRAVPMGQKATALAAAADSLRALLGPPPAPGLLIAELPVVEEPLRLPGAVLLPPGGLGPLLQGEAGGEELLAELWWGGMVRPASGRDGRWLQGFAAGLASLLREESGAEPPGVEGRLWEEYWALSAEERVPLGRASGAESDAAVIVPAAAILRGFADYVGREKLTVALTGATAHYRGREVGLMELTGGLETRAGLREGDFFGPWLLRSGPARLRLDWDSEPRSGRHEVTVTLRQDEPAVPLSVVVDFTDGSERLRRTLQTVSAERSLPFMLPFDPARVVEDPDGRLFRWTEARERQAARLESVHQAGRLTEEALLLLEQGERKQARRLLEQAVEVDPTHPLARLELGRTLVLDRKIDRSRAVLLPLAREVVGAEYAGMEWARSWAEVWIGHGWDLRRDRRKALDAYHRALELPGGRGAHRAAQDGIERPFDLRRGPASR